MSSPLQPIGVVLAFGDDPKERVAGLSLALRALLELARAGLADLVLVTPDAAIGEEIARDGRVTAPVRVVAGDSLAALASLELRAAAVVVPAEAVADCAVYATLVDAARRGEVVHAPASSGMGPFVVTVDRVAALQISELPVIDAGWVLRADGAVGKRQVVNQLFEGCRKDVDGIVSRHLNRHVSIFVSKRVVDTDISPNTITVMTLCLGVVAALVTAQATYVAMLTGAALLQLNSILDGVDGELARVRFQHSKLGQWLDTVCDDLANTMFYAGVTYAAWVTASVPPYWFWFGVAAVSGSLLTMAMYYTELVRLGSGDFYALDVGQDVERTGLWGALNRAARYMTKRDFFVFAFVVAAAFDVLLYALPVMAVGTLATVVTGLRITLARLSRA